MKPIPRLFGSRKIILSAISLAALATTARAEVPYADANPFERSVFGNDWSILSNDIFFGGAYGVFGLSPATRAFVFSTAPSSTTSKTDGTVSAADSSAEFSSFASSLSPHFVLNTGGPVSGGGGGDAPFATTGGPGVFYTGAGGNWDATAAWGPSPTTHPDAPGAVAAHAQVVNGDVDQNVPGLGGTGITVGVIDNNPTTPLNSGQNVSWTITTTEPITLDSGSSAPAQINNSQAVGTSSLTINGTTNGLRLVSNLTITNLNPGGLITISAPISDAAPNVAGDRNITIVGPGTVLLSGSNSFGGTTTISSGTLNLAGQDALGGTSSVTVNSGGTLLFSGPSTDRIRDGAAINLNGGTINTAGLSEGGPSTPGLGALSLTSANVIDLGNAASLIAFANSNGTWTGTLSILNWSGSIAGGGLDQVYFGNDANGLSSGQLDQISFFSDGGSNLLGTAQILNTGEIVPLAAAPEPSTWVGAAITLLVLGFTQRRKFFGLMRS